MSEKSFEDWKKDIEKRSKQEQQNESGGITGADLAQL